MPAADPGGRLILLGRVAGAFGVRGEVRITAYTVDPKSLLAYGPLLTADGGAALTLVRGRAVKNTLIAETAPALTREEAQALRGVRLYVARGALPPPDEDEFYVADLIGLAAVSPSGAPLGRVKSVHDFGAGDLLEIEPQSGATWWVPFTLAAVPQVRIEGGVIVVVRPLETEDEEG